MSSYSTSEFKSGLKVLFDNVPCSIVENEFVKPGKGQAFNRVKLRNLKTGRLWEKTFKSGESLPAADVLDIDMDFLYSDEDFMYFMKADDSYEQLSVSKAIVGDASHWIEAQTRCVITLWNGEIILVQPPNFVELEIVGTDPGVRGDTVSGGLKPATLSTGVVVRVPLFIAEGEVIRVDTRTNEYMGRVKR